MSEWEDFTRSIGETETAVRNLDASIMQAGADEGRLCELYAKIDGFLEVLKVQKKAIENQLASGVHPQIGSFDRLTADGKYRVTVSWPEKKEWDKDKVAEIAQLPTVAEIPLFVEHTWSIDGKVWARASDEERAPFLPALTIKPGTRKVEVDAV